MKKIHFDHLPSNRWIKVIFFLSIIGFILGVSELIPFENPKGNNLLLASSSLLQSLYFGRFLFFKNYVQWNKRGAHIKLNSFFGKTLNFDNVKAVNLNTPMLEVEEVGGKKLSFDMKDFSENDQKTLYAIILEHAV